LPKRVAAEPRAARRATVWRCFGLIAAMLCCLAGPGPRAQTPQEDAGPPDVAPGEVPLEITYEVRFEGVEDEELRQLLEQVSETVRLVDRPPSSLLRLRRRAEDDRARLQQALRSRGHYAASIDVEVDNGTPPARVVFEVDPGPLYQLGEVSIEAVPPTTDVRLPSPGELGLASGAPAASRAILDGEAELLRRVRAQAFALAELGERRAVVDHDTRTMDLTLRVQPGPKVRFGPIEVAGLNEVEKDFVLGRLPWEPGELITPERVDQGRQNLLDSQLFSTVRIDLGDAPDAEGRLPVTIHLAERPHRSIGVGVRYRTDEGPGGSLSWEHRNVFARGERVEVELDASGIGTVLSSEFRKPDFWLRDQVLVVRGELDYLNTDAYDSRSIGAGLGLERLLAPEMRASAGIAFRSSRVEDNEGDETFGLVSLPMTFDWDRSDDLLDPTEDGRVSVANEPFVDVFGNNLAFNRTELGYSHYLQVLQQPSIVLAGRGVVGTMFGASRGAIPADERFYAGGGGSVRGFGYQLAGELDDDDKPIGGRSLLELSGEIRGRFTDTIGAVVFVDAGAAFESEVPDLDEPLRIGTGVGLRYFSPIGPFRLDVGFPVNRRDVDDPFQIYVSLGQAF
jgi:translocation and assembly module TamA